MKKEIKLTQKQQQVLETLGNMLEKENFKQIPVSDLYCNMTAVKQIITANWFDRTFNKLEELGLVKKEDMQYEIKGGYKKGEIVETYCYNLTELGFEYLGITNPNKQDNQEEWQELINNLDTEEGRQKFINAAPSGLYTGENEDKEKVITIVSQGVGMTVKTKHHARPRWWECVDYDELGCMESVTYEIAE